MPTIIQGTNCYVTIEEANEFLDQMYMTDDWTHLEDDEKARLLITATRQINRLPCKYKQATDEQKLLYPVNVRGKVKGEDEAKEATIQQAWFLFRNHENVLSAQDQAIQNIRSENLGAIQTAKSVAGYNPFKSYDPEVYKLLSEFVTYSFRTPRG